MSSNSRRGGTTTKTGIRRTPAEVALAVPTSPSTSGLNRVVFLRGLDEGFIIYPPDNFDWLARQRTAESNQPTSCAADTARASSTVAILAKRSSRTSSVLDLISSGVHS